METTDPLDPPTRDPARHLPGHRQPRLGPHHHRLTAAKPGETHLTRYHAPARYLDQRWQEGCTNAWKPWEEIKVQGYPRGYASVRDYVSRTLRGKPQPVGPRPPSARAVTRWILTHPDAIAESDRIQLKAARANYPELTALAEHVRSFAHMLTHLHGDQLPDWIEAASATTDLPSLRHFAQHLLRDLDAVTAGLTLPWNSGVVEGHVNRIKMLKRQMFGRAGFEFLRKRVLLST
ncbi:transposase [Streptomyces tauricus]|uniref:transposase n=1 Tax=Streptomyces tauricus TaxID=68274 RepID=UPI00387F0967